MANIDWGNTAVNAGSNLLGGAINSIFGNSQARNNYKYSKKLMQYQQQLNTEMYNRQRKDNLQDYATQRKDYVDDILNNSQRQRRSMQSAGLNMAFGSDAGFSAAQPLGASIGQSEYGGLPSANFNGFDSNSLVNGASLVPQQIDLEQKIADIRNTDANTKAVQTQTEKMQAEFENWQNVTKQILNDTLTTTLDNLKKEGKLTEKKQEEITQHITNMQYDVLSTTFDVYRGMELLPYEVSKLVADTKAAIASATASYASAHASEASAALDRVKTYFAKMGIGVGGNFFESCAALLSSPQGSEIVPRVLDNLVATYQKIANMYENGFEPTGYFDTPDGLREYNVAKTNLSLEKEYNQGIQRVLNNAKNLGLKGKTRTNFVNRNIARLKTKMQRKGMRFKY